MDETAFVPLVVAISLGILFIGLPWLILHYLTKWKQAKTLTIEDENLLDELYDIARSLDGRMNSIERIIAADRDHPGTVADLRSDIRSPELRVSELGTQALASERLARPFRKEI